jgi:hypothetical protein
VTVVTRVTCHDKQRCLCLYYYYSVPSLFPWTSQSLHEFCSYMHKSFPFCDHWTKETNAYKSHFHMCSYIVVKGGGIIYVDFPTSRQINIYNIPRYCKILFCHEHSTNISFILSVVLPLISLVIRESCGKSQNLLYKLSHVFLHIPFHSYILSNDASRPADV